MVLGSRDPCATEGIEDRAGREIGGGGGGRLSRPDRSRRSPARPSRPLVVLAERSARGAVESVSWTR
jgi:hypothetical protein